MNSFAKLPSCYIPFPYRLEVVNCLKQTNCFWSIKKRREITLGSDSITSMGSRPPGPSLAFLSSSSSSFRAFSSRISALSFTLSLKELSSSLNAVRYCFSACRILHRLKKNYSKTLKEIIEKVCMYPWYSMLRMGSELPAAGGFAF